MADSTPAVNHPLSSKGLFVPLDANYADDWKIVEAGFRAELLYIRSLAIAKRIGTDGAIHRALLFRLCGDLADGVTCDEIAGELVRVGLWLEELDGYRIAAWDRWNLTADEIEERRRSKAEGGALGNHRRWHAARGVVDPDCTYCTESVDRSDSDSGTDRGANPQSEVETETKSTDTAPKEPPRKAERDALFSALVDVFGPATSPQRKTHYGKTVTTLLQMRASPDQVRARGKVLLAKDWDNPSPEALLKWWDTLEAERPRGEFKTRERDGKRERFMPGTGWVPAL